MKFDDLDRQMRAYETVDDRCILPDMYVIARLDGRGFTHLTEACGFVKPYSAVFRDVMVQVLQGIMADSGFNFDYGYTQSDEISLLFKYGDDTFNRKIRKLISLLAAEATARFTHAIGAPARFDARVIEFPAWPRVADYFRWRQEDATRNCLNSYCYWTIRQREQMSGRQAHSTMMGLSRAAKHDMLMRYGINFNDLPVWQRRGVGIYRGFKWVDGVDPRSGTTTQTQRTTWEPTYNLPIGDTYTDDIAFVGKPLNREEIFRAS